MKSFFTGEHKLTAQILLAIVLAFALASLAPQFASQLEAGGTIFLKLLKMMVIPLVVSSVMSGILNMGDVRKLGKPGGITIGYYLTTTMLAVIIGLLVVNITRPGDTAISPEKIEQVSKEPSREQVKAKLREQLVGMTGASEPTINKIFPMLQGEQEGIGRILQNLLLMCFTDNLFKSAYNMDILPLIVFSIIFASVLTTMGRRVEGVTSLIDQANEAFMATILVFMKVAPLGIFCLVTARFGAAAADGTFVQELSQIGLYFATVLIALAIHALLVLPALYWYFTRKNPYQFMWLMSRALLTAFSTASSSATLPLTMETAMDKAQVSEKAVKFVLPLGATINMDGTALYEAVAAIFVAQVAAQTGVIEEFTLVDQVVVAITATLAAIGAAGIPEAGLVTMIIVFNAVGLPIEYIGLILSVDWLLDRFRTTVNVFGDAVGASIVERSFPDRKLLA